MVIEGCILVVLAILALILLLAVRKIKCSEDLEVIDGVIVASDSQKKEVTISYTIDNQSFTSSYNCEVYANVGEMPPIGLYVQLSVNLQNPSEIVYLHLMREMGRGLSGKHKYIDNKRSKNTISMTFLILSLFLTGVYFILNGLSVI